jgi:succinylglutamate desuccinylase
MPNKQLLIIIATHGNEPIGVEVIKKLQAKKLDQYFDFLIANPRALKKEVRFVDKDLNRSYPGKADSKYYEERQAIANLKIAKQYKYIIDIHEANQGRDDFIIVPRKKLSNKFPIDFINLKKVLLWPDPLGPLSQVLTNAIELEFGSKNRNRQKMITKAEKIIIQFIKKINSKQPSSYQAKNIYYVYGKLLTEKNINIKKIKDFQLTKVEREKFYPLLTGQYLSDGVVCYKMRKQ